MARLRRRMRFEHLESRALLAATIGIADVVLDAGSPEAQVVASLEIDNAAGLRGAAVEIHYDQHLMKPDLASVRAGSIWDGKGVAIANVNDQDGTITAFIFATQDMSLSSGSLLDIDFSFKDQTIGDVRANIGVGSLRLNEGEMPVSPLPIEGQAAINGSITRKETPRDQPSSLETIGTAARPSVARPAAPPIASVADTAAVSRMTSSLPAETTSKQPVHLPRAAQPATVPPVVNNVMLRQTTVPPTTAVPAAIGVQSQAPAQWLSASAEQKVVTPRGEAPLQLQRSTTGNPDVGSVGDGNPDAGSVGDDGARSLQQQHASLLPSEPQLYASSFIGPTLSDGLHIADASLLNALSAAADSNAAGGQSDESSAMEPSLGRSEAGVVLKGKSLGQIGDFTGRSPAARKEPTSLVAPQGRRGATVLPSIGLLASRGESASAVDRDADDEIEDPMHG